MYVYVYILVYIYIYIYDIRYLGGLGAAINQPIDTVAYAPLDIAR